MFPHKISRLVSLILLTLFICTSANAQQQNKPEQIPNKTPDRTFVGFENVGQLQPLWEVGLAGGIANVPNYPGSAERNQVGAVLPYFIYRGDIFRVGDGNGARAVLGSSEKWQLDVSFGGAFEAESEDGTVREGMPELDFLFEFGPQIIYQVFEDSYDDGGESRLNLHLQTRAVFSTDFGNFNQRGYVFEPELQWQQRGRLLPHTALSLRIKATFATEKLHDYFYQVDPQFVTETRPAYDAKAGYIGADIGAAFSFNITKKLRAFISASVQIHEGAANQDSPLFERTNTADIAVGFVWRFYTSKARASF